MMKTNGSFEGAVHLPARSPTRALLLVGAAFALMLSMLGHALLVAPQASALTQDEVTYVNMLEQKGIYPWPGTTYTDLAQGGHMIAYDLRRGVNPVDEAYYLWKINGTLSLDQSVWEVACATVVFAPELIPPSTYVSPPVNSVA